MGFLFKRVLVCAYFYPSVSFIDRKVDLPKTLWEVGEGLWRTWGGWGWLGLESADPCHIYVVSVGKDTSSRTPSSSLSLEAMEGLAAVSLTCHTFSILRISRNFYLYFPGAVLQLCLYWPLRGNQGFDEFVPWATSLIFHRDSLSYLL